MLYTPTAWPLLSAATVSIAPDNSKGTTWIESTEKWFYLIVKYRMTPTTNTAIMIPNIAIKFLFLSLPSSFVQDLGFGLLI